MTACRFMTMTLIFAAGFATSQATRRGTTAAPPGTLSISAITKPLIITRSGSTGAMINTRLEPYRVYADGKMILDTERSQAPEYWQLSLDDWRYKIFASAHPVDDAEEILDIIISRPASASEQRIYRLRPINSKSSAEAGDRLADRWKITLVYRLQTISHEATYIGSD